MQNSRKFRWGLESREKAKIRKSLFRGVSCEHKWHWQMKSPVNNLAPNLIVCKQIVIDWLIGFADPICFKRRKNNSRNCGAENRIKFLCSVDKQRKLDEWRNLMLFMLWIDHVPSASEQFQWRRTKGTRNYTTIRARVIYRTHEKNFLNGDFSG